MVVVEVTYVDRMVGPQVRTMLTFEADNIQQGYDLRRKFSDKNLGRIWDSCYYYKEEYDFLAYWWSNTYRSWYGNTMLTSTTISILTEHGSYSEALEFIKAGGKWQRRAWEMGSFSTWN